LTKSVGPRGALAGVVAGIAGVTIVGLQLNISWQWYVLIGSTITFATGTLTSSFLKEKLSGKTRLISAKASA